MAYKLSDSLAQAQTLGVAIGHFNFATMAMARGIFDAARELSIEIPHGFSDGKIPVVLGISEGDRKLFGTEEALAIVKLWRYQYDYPIFLDADHVHDVVDAQKIIEMGYDMVIFDAVESPIEENIRMTKSVVDYRNSLHSTCLVEAEIGFIASGSDLKQGIPSGVGPDTLTDPEVAVNFAYQTGVDALAPSIGNIHGMVVAGDTLTDSEKLDIDRVRALRTRLGNLPMVLHGGSGINDDNFRAAISAGITMVHISTDIRRVYRDALQTAILQNTDSVSPAKYVPAAQTAVRDCVKRYMQLFTHKG